MGQMYYHTEVADAGEKSRLRRLVEQEASMKNILVATDGSAAAGRAVDLAAQLTTSLGGKLKIVSVVPEHEAPSPDLQELSRAEHQTLREFLCALSEQCLATARRRAQERGVSDAEVESRTGDVAGSILDIARLDEAEVIVVGKRGLGRLSGLLLGSVSQKIVSLAECPVIVVP
jgi:nucleotide-binding universal stress UspA family protein